MMVLAASALLKLAGVEVSGVAEVALVLGLAIAQSVLPVIGHAAITRAPHLLVVPFAAPFGALAWLTAGKLDPAQLSTASAAGPLRPRRAGRRPRPGRVTARGGRPTGRACARRCCA